MKPTLIDRILSCSAEWFRREREGPHTFCWFVVFYGVGILLFFQSSGDASLFWTIFITIVCSICWVISARYWPSLTPIALAFLAVLSGFLTGVTRIHWAETAVLQEIQIARVKGYVENVEFRIDKSPQLIIRPLEIENLSQTQLPRRIRVTLRTGMVPNAGAMISAKMRLLPLPQPVHPGGYDFARDAYFKGIGAIGSVLGKVQEHDQIETPPLSLRLAAAIDRARNNLTKRIHDTVPNDSGGVAAALVTGKRGFIPEATNDALRAAGIYHIVSISGLHMVIAAGIIFWLSRSLLALFPVLALRWPIKSIAAIIAMFGATVYCFFAGADIATLRALIMTLIVLGAIVAQRKALSMHNLAIAAFILLIFTPEALLSPGFQMSFSAVAALIFFSNMSHYLTLPMRGGVLLRSAIWGVNWLIALILTTIIAGLATAPFAAYHFQTAVPFGLIGNALALPLVSLIIMPMGALGALAYPFALDRPIWLIMGWATDLVVRVSYWVASLEGALLYVPLFGAGAVLLAAFSLILITVTTTPLRYISIFPLLLAALWALTPDRYIAFIDRDGRTAAMRGEDGKLFILGNANRFLVEQWLRADGDGRKFQESLRNDNMTCDTKGCVGRGLITVSIVKNPIAFREDCLRADIIVSSYLAPSTCKVRIIIDRKHLFSKGATAIMYEKDGTLSVISSRESEAVWPWLPKTKTFSQN